VVDPELLPRARHRQNQRVALALACTLVPIILIEVAWAWRRATSHETPSGSGRASWISVVILAVPVVAGSEQYLEWVARTVGLSLDPPIYEGDVGAPSA
jgi:hypothetical protein